MSEYTAPNLVNNYVTAKILTNVSQGSIMLQVQNNNATESISPTVIQLPYNQSILYNSVVDSDQTSMNYNADLIADYVNNGVLSTSTITPQSPVGSLKGILGSTHTLGIANAQLTKQTSINQIDGLELFYSVTANNLTTTLNILVYRSLSGFYYSLDSGKSIIPIPTLGMNYPIQVTSIGIQSLFSVTTPGAIKIWAGTLQEGLLSYTIGNSSWVSEVNAEQLSGYYIFRNTLIYNIYNYSNVLQSSTTTTQGYAPVYILGVLNNPTDAGLPILVYTKPITTTTTATLDVTNTVVASSVDSAVKNIFTVYKYTSPNYFSYVLNTTYGIYNKQVATLLPAALGYTWTAFTNPFTNEVCDVLKSIPYLTEYGMINSSQTVTAVATYSTSLTEYIVEIIYISVSNDIGNGTTLRSINITKDTNIGITTIINPNQFTGLSYFNTDIFITTRNNIFRYTNNAWVTWLTANDTATPERNLCINSNLVFTLTSPISYITGLRGFGILQNSTPNSSFGILNTDYGYVIFNLTQTISDDITPITNSKSLRPDIFGTSIRDLQIIPEINMAISCGLNTEPLNRYILPTGSFEGSLRYSVYVPQIASKLPSNIVSSNTQIFYKNYTLTEATLPYLINQFNYYGEIYINDDQLYTNVNNTSNVSVLKSLPNIFTYVDTNNNYTWLDSVTAIYVSNVLKYNRLKFLLQTTQTIPLVGATLSSNLEVPFVPDIDFNPSI